MQLTPILCLLACQASADPILPAFDPGAFSAPKANPYFPLTIGEHTRLTGTATTETGPVPALLARSVIGEGPVIAGVQTTAMVDAEYEGGLLMELTTDYYAADNKGNVWYFGEDVTNFTYSDAGILTASETGASWHAGVGDGQPGIAMQAQPTGGVSQFTGFAPTAKETDFAEVLETGLTMTLGAQTYTDVIKVYTQSQSDPDLRDFRFYAPGTGLIRVEEDLSPALDAPVITLERQP